MTCVICKVELVEEFVPVPSIGLPHIQRKTGYSICPSCGLVYKEKE